MINAGKLKKMRWMMGANSAFVKPFAYLPGQCLDIEVGHDPTDRAGGIPVQSNSGMVDNCVFCLFFLHYPLTSVLYYHVRWVSPNEFRAPGV
jgi:hypothetical protein